MLRTIDLYVRLYLRKLTGGLPGFERIAEDLGVGIGTAHRSVKRLAASGLVLPCRTVQRRALLDVLLHAARHVYDVDPGGSTRGVRTADARGYAIEPLRESAPRVAKRDPDLYAPLALVDALRIGQAGVRNLAASELRERLAP